MTQNKVVPSDALNWTLRRRVIQITLVISIGLVGYISVYANGNSQLAQTLVDYLLILIGSTIGGYVFGTAVDNHVNGGLDISEGNNKHKIESVVDHDTRLGSWRQRRRALVLVLLACNVGLVYLAFEASDTKVHETVAEGICILYATVLNSWIFGGVYDGYAIRRKIAGVG